MVVLTWYGLYYRLGAYSLSDLFIDLIYLNHMTDTSTIFISQQSRPADYPWLDALDIPDHWGVESVA